MLERCGIWHLDTSLYPSSNWKEKRSWIQKMPTHAPTLCLKLSSNVQILWLRLSTLGIALRDCILQRTQFQLEVYLEKQVRVGTYCEVDKVNKKITMFFEFCPTVQQVCFCIMYTRLHPCNSEFIKRRNNSVSNLIWLQSPLPFNIAVLSLYKECLSFEIWAK